MNPTAAPVSYEPHSHRDVKHFEMQQVYTVKPITFRSLINWGLTDEEVKEAVEDLNCLYNLVYPEEKLKD